MDAISRALRLKLGITTLRSLVENQMMVLGKLMWCEGSRNDLCRTLTATGQLVVITMVDLTHDYGIWYSTCIGIHTQITRRSVMLERLRLFCHWLDYT